MNDFVLNSFVAQTNELDQLKAQLVQSNQRVKHQAEELLKLEAAVIARNKQIESLKERIRELEEKFAPDILPPDDPIRARIAELIGPRTEELEVGAKKWLRAYKNNGL